jgi:hypothetical protein
MVFFHLNLGLVSGLFRSDIPAKGEHTRTDVVCSFQLTAAGLSEVLATARPVAGYFVDVPSHTLVDWRDSEETL